MSALPETVDDDERLDLLDALVYGDAFDCAVTLDELWRYGRRRVDLEALRSRLRNDPVLRRIVLERDGLYCLRDRSELLDRRAERIARAGKLRRRAERVAAVLRLLPFVRGLALTGSAAADDAGERDDVDLLVIVEPGRVGTVFLVLGPASRLIGRRVFCPNYYLPADRLGISTADLYVARELDQARSLAGTGGALRGANSWLSDVFPNALAPDAPDERPSRSFLQRVLEAPLRGRLGDRLERFGLGVAGRRLRAHYAAFGRNVPADVSAEFESGKGLPFHAADVIAPKMERYAARRAEVAARLRKLDGKRAPARSSPR
jgi:predicted nucleotidyltransferase